MPYILLIPVVLLTLYLLNIIALCTFNIILVAFLLIFIVGPLTYKYSYRFQRSTIFLNFVTIPLQPHLKEPSKCGLKGVLNFYLRTDEDITLGVWHVAPEESIEECDGKGEEYYRSLLRNGKDVVVYNHGNAGNRSAPHRVELYEVLRKQFHVIAFDYRSYGDSSKVPPSERGTVNDSTFMFKWVLGIATGNVFVWGHSLGTGISTHMLDLVSAENISPVGLILESPFNNIRDEIRMHPFAKLFHRLPWFTYTIIEPIAENKLLFKSDEHINNVNCPILILHAKDDIIVPFQLGLKLYSGAKENRLKTQGKIQFHQYDESYGYGHKYICRAPDLGDVIRNFVIDCTKNVNY